MHVVRPISVITAPIASGASALMQGLADGYFVLPYTIGSYLSKEISTGTISTDQPEFDHVERQVNARIQQLMTIGGKQSAESFHRRISCGTNVEWHAMQRIKTSHQRNTKPPKGVLERSFWYRAARMISILN